MSDVSLQSTPTSPEPQTEATASETPVPEAAPTPTPTPEAAAIDWQARALQAERDLALRMALQAVTWFHPEDALKDLQSRAVQDASGVWCVNAHATGATIHQAEGSEPKKLSPAEAVRELAARKPNLVKARLQGGTGANGSISVQIASTANRMAPAPAEAAAQSNGLIPLSYSELLRPENKPLLQEYVHHKREELERMRAAHFRG